MNYPNEKLLKALESFFNTKVADMEKKYHFDQTVRYCIISERQGYYINIDEIGIFFTRFDTPRGNKQQLEELAKAYNREIPELFYSKFYYGFYSHYKDIVKHFDRKQKEQDDLYRAVARFENRDKEPEQFTL